MRSYVGAVAVLGLAAVGCLEVLSPPDAGGKHEAPGRKTAAAPVRNPERIAGSASFSLPSSFEPAVAGVNSPSQTAAQFISRATGMTALLTARGIELRATAQTAGKHSVQRRGAAVSIRIANHGDEPLSWKGEKRLPAVSNYLLGADPKRWRTGVPHFAEATAAVMPGVDIRAYAGDGGTLEYDLELAPGAEPSALRLKISGADRISLTPEGDIVMLAGGREFRMKGPATFQESLGVRTALDCHYLLSRDGTVRFRVGRHRANARLVIDPILSVAYSTFLGGAGTDSANSLAMDSDGNLYVGGTTTQASFAESSTTLGPGGGAADYFIAKINPSKTGLNSLVYLTFLGGSGTETGGLIAVDSSSDVFITGTTTSNDFPVTDNTTRTSGANDVTLTEIDPTGAKLVFSTLFGGSGAEATQNGGGIALGKQSVYIASDTTSSDLPVTQGALQGTYNSSVTDGFLAKFTLPATSGSGASPTLAYCTYLGFNAQVGVTSVAVDANGNAYLTGFTSNPGSGFVATNGFQRAYGGGDFDAFLMKINPAGTGSSDLAYATLLGGSGSDQAFAVAVDSATPPNAYVTGTTDSTNFPVNGTLAPYQASLNSSPVASNAFVSVVAQNPNTFATSLHYSTYLGGSQTDAGIALALATSSSGAEIYVAGSTTSGDFPALDNAQPFNGDQDAFLTKLVPGLGGVASLVYSTPLSGTAGPGLTAISQANGILTDGNGHIYLAGSTSAADFPRAGNPMNGAQVACASCQENPPASDAFVTAITEASGLTPAVSFKVSAGAGNVNFGGQNVGSQNVPMQPVELFNSGDAPLVVSGITIGGVNQADFSLSGLGSCTTAGSLVPQQGCSFEVGFVPSVVGPEEAFVTVTDNAPGSPQLLAAIGVGNGPLASFSPTALAFGTVSIGATSIMTTTLSNIGNQSLLVFTPKVIGQTPEFSVNGNECPLPLLAGASCSLVVAFTPESALSFQAELTLVDNSGAVTGDAQPVTLTGTGSNQPPPPVASLFPMSLVFGSQVTGTITGVQTVTVTNTGAGPLNLTSISLKGMNVSSFAIVKSGGTPCPTGSGIVAAGATCTVGVSFTPQVTGLLSANLAFTDNAGSSPQEVSLTGTGFIPSIQISPASINFGSQSVGIPTAAQNVAITNSGSGPLSFSGAMTFQGANPQDFSENDTCGASSGASIGNTAPNNTCTVSITFTPQGPGSRSASLVIHDDAPGAPHMVPLSGTATQSALTLSTSTETFPNEIGGTASAAQTVTVTNSGTGALKFNGISFSGANPASFSEKDTCTGNVTIAPMATCTIQVTFTPQSDGALAATMMLADNAPTSPQSVSLGGTGVDFSISPANGAQTTATLNVGQTATYSLVIGGGAGAVPLSCGVTPAVASGPVCTVPANASESAPFMASVSTTAAADIPVRPFNWRTPPPAPLFVFATFWVIASARRYRHSHAVRIAQSLAIAGLLALAFAACGGGGGDPAAVTGTPTGAYTVNVTGSAGGTNHSMQLMLTVQ